MPLRDPHRVLVKAAFDGATSESFTAGGCLPGMKGSDTLWSWPEARAVIDDAMPAKAATGLVIYFSEKLSDRPHGWKKRPTGISLYFYGITMQETRQFCQSQRRGLAGWSEM